MKVGILTQYYPPEIGAPQARLSHLVKKLAERGHEVYVLTAWPNYPIGRIYPGFRRVLYCEKQGCITIIRTFIYPTQSVKFVPRLLSYLSFVFSSLVTGMFFLPRLDYLITESPPLFLGLSGYLLSRFKKARWIFNVSDLWPESAVRLGFIGSGWQLRLGQILEAFCYRRTWLVTGQSQEILRNIQKRFPAVAAYHFSNGADPTLFSPDKRSIELRKKLTHNNTCIAIYAGLHGIAQGLDQLLEAAFQLRNLDHFLMILVGDGPEKKRLMERSKTMGLANVRFMDPVPYVDMPSLLASSDVALVPLKVRLPGAIPSKIYEAMSSALPVVLAGDGEAAQIIKECQAGYAVSPGEVSTLTAILRRLVQDSGTRLFFGRLSRQAVGDRFDRNEIASRFIDFLERN